MSAPLTSSRTPSRTTYDAIVVGGGHNGLTAAAYLARAGWSVLLLERLDHVGGAAVSAQVFPGVDARLSRYSYLVSLMPRAVVEELGLSLELRRRRYSSYTPVPGGDGRGLLVDEGDPEATAASFARVTGSGTELAAWQELYGRVGALAQRLWPTVTEPLMRASQVRELVGDDRTWSDLVERPLSEVLERTFTDDTVRGVVLTDALIGTFAQASESDLRQNRCFLYHVIGGGTGDWDVPVGGMGAVTAALADAARGGGAELLTSTDVVSVDAGPAEVEVTWHDGEGREHGARAAYVLSGAAPSTLARLTGETAPPSRRPEGAQLKVNMLLSRLPRLREDVDPVAAFSGTFHVNEGYAQLQRAYDEAAAGQVPTLPPCEIYCHSLTDPSILGPDLRQSGAQTLTLFGLHMPARLFEADNEGARAAALEATLRSLDSVLAEPLRDVLLTGPDGTPCLEARTPVDLEGDVGLPGGHIFHRDLAWPWVDDDAPLDSPAERWGVATDHDRLLLCGAGARRGGGVSGIAGRSAAMALLSATRSAHRSVDVRAAVADDVPPRAGAAS